MPHHLKIFQLVFNGFLLGLLLTACSSVDSTKEFNEQQAADLLHQNRYSQPTRQMVKIALPEKNLWKKIDLSYGTIGSPMMLVPCNECREHWNQSIRTKILAYRDDPDATINKFLQNEITEAKRNCQIADASILSRKKDSFIYSLNKAHCQDEKDQLQIGKAFAGEDGIYLVYYSAVCGQISSCQIAKLSSTIKTAKLISQKS